MTKIYETEDLAKERTDLILVESEAEHDHSYGQLCCSPKYRRATFVGCMLFVF